MGGGGVGDEVGGGVGSEVGDEAGDEVGDDVGGEAAHGVTYIAAKEQHTGAVSAAAAAAAAAAWNCASPDPAMAVPHVHAHYSAALCPAEVATEIASLRAEVGQLSS